MKTSILFIFLFSILNLQENVSNHQFDKNEFYKILSSENLAQLEDMITIIKKVSLPDREAYEGALLMKKAGFLNNKKAQLSLFRNGKIKLDTIILKNKENCEFRLLRLIIQENAPPFLGYNKQIEEDCILIKKQISRSSILLQNIILDYSKKSKKLNLTGS